MVDAIQVGDGDGDLRTDEDRARDLILEAMRANADRLAGELIAKFPGVRLGENKEIGEYLKKLQQEIIDKLQIPPHMLKKVYPQ